MKLQSEQEDIHISHFMHLLSAYEPSEEMINEFIEDIETALGYAYIEKKTQYVSQDTLDFFLAVHPSGTIDLCCRMRSFTTKTNQTESN